MKTPSTRFKVHKASVPEVPQHVHSACRATSLLVQGREISVRFRVSRLKASGPEVPQHVCECVQFMRFLCVLACAEKWRFLGVSTRTSLSPGSPSTCLQQPRKVAACQERHDSERCGFACYASKPQARKSLNMVLRCRPARKRFLTHSTSLFGVASFNAPDPEVPHHVHSTSRAKSVLESGAISERFSRFGDTLLSLSSGSSSTCLCAAAATRRTSRCTGEPRNCTLRTRFKSLSPGSPSSCFVLSLGFGTISHTLHKLAQHPFESLRPGSPSSCLRAAAMSHASRFTAQVRVERTRFNASVPEVPRHQPCDFVLSFAIPSTFQMKTKNAAFHINFSLSPGSPSSCLHAAALSRTAHLCETRASARLDDTLQSLGPGSPPSCS